MFFDVGLKENEVSPDEFRDFIVGVGFGLQPNARPSSGRRAEIDQQRPFRAFRFSERRVGVFIPLNRHADSVSPGEKTSTGVVFWPAQRRSPSIKAELRRSRAIDFATRRPLNR